MEDGLLVGLDPTIILGLEDGLLVGLEIVLIELSCTFDESVGDLTTEFSPISTELLGLKSLERMKAKKATDRVKNKKENPKILEMRGDSDGEESRLLRSELNSLSYSNPCIFLNNQLKLLISAKVNNRSRIIFFLLLYDS